MERVWHPRTSVKLRFAAIQGLLIVLIVGLMAGTLGFSARRYLVSTTDNAYKILANNLSAGIYPFFSAVPDAKNAAQIATTVHKVEGQQGVKYVLIVDGNDKVYYDTFNQLVGQNFHDALSDQVAVSHGDLVVGKAMRSGSNDQYYDYVAPFLLGDKVLYTVRLGVGADQIDGQFNSLVRTFVYTSVLGIILGILVAYFLSAQMTKPIISLTESALAIRAGNLNAYPDVQTGDELEQLAREFQSMVEKLKTFYFQEYLQKKEAIDARVRLEEVNGRLQDLDRQKTDFLNAASHQLRTPLSIIHWSLSIIVESKAKLMLNKDQAELLDEALKSTKRMVDLVNDLLDVSRIEEGRMELVWDSGNYGRVCAQLVAALQPLATQKNLTLTYEQLGEIPDSFLDEKKFYQVVNNFVDNAIKYTTQGWVHVTCQTEGGDHVVIKVSDSGIGMTDEERTRLFTRFTRGSDASKMNANGSGLGMFLAKTILAEHGGDIEVQSSKGNGTVFVLTVPIYQKKPQPKGANIEPPLLIPADA